MRLLQLIGVAAVVLTIFGSLPGMSFHVYFGTEKGATEWHEEWHEKLSAQGGV